MMLQLPKLYFKKTHKKTQAEFVDFFEDRNCREWSKTSFCDLHVRAHQRVKHWNEQLSDWHYEVIGWNVEGIDCAD